MKTLTILLTSAIWFAGCVAPGAVAPGSVAPHLGEANAAPLVYINADLVIR